VAPRRPTLEHAVLDEMLCFDLYAASRAMMRRYRPLLDEHGLTYPQYLLLLVLHTAPATPIKDLVATLSLDHATLTPLLRRMEADGLLERTTDPGDRRSALISLTDRGRALHDRSAGVHCVLFDEIGMTPDQTRELQLTLRRVAGAVERGLADAT
jgi:MarR family transcriptional regulator, organic hydroperoxide resistance regulator